MSRDPAVIAEIDQAGAELCDRARAAGVALDRDTVAFVVLDLLMTCAICCAETPEADAGDVAEFPFLYAKIAAAAVGATEAQAFLALVDEQGEARRREEQE